MESGDFETLFRGGRSSGMQKAWVVYTRLKRACRHSFIPSTLGGFSVVDRVGKASKDTHFPSKPFK